MNESEHYLEQPKRRDKNLPRFACERCGRIVGEAILRCPDRPQGRCPYRVRNLAPWGSRVGSAVGMIISILMLFFFWQSEQPMVQICGSVVLPIIFIAALLETLRTSTLLYDPVSRLKWKRTAFLGITTQRTLIPGGHPLHLDLTFPRLLPFPPSVTKFSETAMKKWTLTHATGVFRAALVGLLARCVIQIQVYPRYMAQWWGKFKRYQNVYVLTITEGLDLNSTDGELERQIILVVRSWVKTRGDEVLEWPDGPPIYELVRAVFKQDVSSPARWVLDLVARDAFTHGQGRFEGWPWKRYRPSASHDVRLQSELATINRLSAQLAQQQPAFLQALNHEIERAIRSRQRQQDYGPYW